MGRWAREKTTPNVKPVEKVELSEKNVGLRIHPSHMEFEHG